MKKENNFGDLPKQYSNEKDSKIVIIPVHYDKTSTWIKGADKGPKALIEASANMELYDIETDSEAYKQGIFTDTPISESNTPEDMIDEVSNKVKQHLDNDKFVITIGGEHSVSIGTLKEHAKKYDDLCVLQLDAHADLRNEYEGSKNNHACVMSRAKETCKVIQVGIRSMDVSEKENNDPDNIFFAHTIHDNKEWFDKAISRLNKNVYITVDLDVFDPSIMPSTGTPEPGGLLWYDAISFLKKVIEERNVVGFDVVELCPNKYNKSPDFLVAKLIYKLLSYIFSKGGKK
ncbi:agmatinase [Candidatus Woesearchaeota archaeon]|nr:agmatinase [Candidatus Woesearchaeota archaeon]